MREIVWTSSAIADLVRIDGWLEHEANPEVAVRTLRAIRERADFLAQFPQGGRSVTSRGFRVLRVQGTPYLLLYRETAGGIDILRVQHERQDWMTES
jgi:toxin ParE1/3/4